MTPRLLLVLHMGTIFRTSVPYVLRISLAAMPQWANFWNH